MVLAQRCISPLGAADWVGDILVEGEVGAIVAVHIDVLFINGEGHEHVIVSDADIDDVPRKLWECFLMNKLTTIESVDIHPSIILRHNQPLVVVGDCTCLII